MIGKENFKLKQAYSASGSSNQLAIEYDKILPTGIVNIAPYDFMDSMVSEFVRERDEHVIRMYQEFEINIDVVQEQQAEINQLRKLIEDHIEGKYTAVVHGRWDDSFDGITPYCTICGRSHRGMNRTPPYCPNCGAKMDGGVNDDRI